jgi:hypothetical protein
MSNEMGNGLGNNNIGAKEANGAAMPVRPCNAWKVTELLCKSFLPIDELGQWTSDQVVCSWSMIHGLQWR